MKKLFKTLITLCVCGLLSFSFVACTETAEVESSMPEEIVESTDSVETSNSESNVIEHEHSYTEVIVEPTCSSKGSKTYTCECGETYSEEISIVPHKYTTYKNVGATCENDGYSISYCDYGCGSYEYIVTEVSNKEHSYEKVEKKEPTCFEKGNEEYFVCSCGKCLDADKKEIEGIPYIDTVKHNYGDFVEEVPATCTEKGVLGHYVCSVCLNNFDESFNKLESLEIDVIEHDYVEYIFDELTHWQKCSCGFETEKSAHNYTKYYSCNDCGRHKELSEVDFVEVICLEDLTAELSKGNNVKLVKDIVGNISYSTDKEVYIDLNGYNLTGNGDDGVVRVNKGIVNIIGKGVIKAVETNSYAISVFVNGGKVVIDGGIYLQEIVGTDEQYDMIYCKEGELVINGGTFKGNTPKWTLNCYDSSYVEGKAKITVNGGDFYGYDPSAVETETESTTSFVSDGKVVENNENWYNVK